MIGCILICFIPMDFFCPFLKLWSNIPDKIDHFNHFRGMRYSHMIVQPSPPSISRTFHHPTPKSHIHYLHDLWHLTISSLLSFSMKLPNLGSSLKWNHTVSVLSCLPWILKGKNLAICPLNPEISELQVIPLHSPSRN